MMDAAQRRDIGIQRMGRLLLQGWVMTDLVCENGDCGMITFRKKDHSIVNFCCLCNDQTDPIPMSVLEPLSATNGDIDLASEPITEETEEIYKELEAEKDVSKLMGQKLLQGCTMMAEPCPECKSVPLMRDREMNLFCVACDSLLVNAEPVIKEAPSVETLVAPPTKDVKLVAKQYEPFDKQDLSRTLIQKLNFLNQSLKGCNSYADIHQITQAIDSTMKALKSVRDF